MNQASNKCSVCGKLFKARMRNAFLCSDKCRKIHKSAKYKKMFHTVVCALSGCANEFTPRASSHRFCSDNCRDAYHSLTGILQRKKLPVTKSCPGCGVEFTTTHHLKAYCSDACCAWGRNTGKYGITPVEYMELLDTQEGSCAICGTKDSNDVRSTRFHIDHDHETGIVRGLLCAPCNRGLGQFRDDLQKMRSAVEYLEGYV